MYGIIKNMMIFTDAKDKEKRKELNKLYNAWKKVIASKDYYISFAGKKYRPLDFFNKDGFFPGYYSTKPRILFIGRESRNCSNTDRIKNESPDTWVGARDSFWERILSLVYGIKGKGKYRFENIHLNDVIKEMQKNNNYGFAIMNISKYSNCNENGTADYNLINSFLTDSELKNRNFIREEIEIYNPDIIITMNLWDGNIHKEFLDLIFPDLSEPEYDNTENVQMRIFYLNGKKIRLVNTYHFWARGKNTQNDFYDPVMKLLFN